MASKGPWTLLSALPMVNTESTSESPLARFDRRRFRNTVPTTVPIEGKQLIRIRIIDKLQRLKALTYQEEAGRILFEMVDITNLASPNTAHVIAFTIDFQTEKYIALSFDFSSDGKRSIELIQLRKIG